MFVPYKVVAEWYQLIIYFSGGYFVAIQSEFDVKFVRKLVSHLGDYLQSQFSTTVEISLDVSCL